jgi:hypothetical protein
MKVEELLNQTVTEVGGCCDNLKSLGLCGNLIWFDGECDSGFDGKLNEI